MFPAIHLLIPFVLPQAAVPIPVPPAPDAVVAATNPDDEPADAEPALPRAVLFENGSIRLGDRDGSIVSGLLAVDGIVRAVGPAADLVLEAEGFELERVDLGGGWAVPGLQDAHGHVENYGRSLEVLDLRPYTDYESMIAAVAAAAAGRPKGEWIEGRGWDQNEWPGGEFPHHAALSAAVPDHLVVLDRVDGHALLCNQAVLELADLDALLLEEPDIEGGRVLIDEKRKATGVLIDRAMALVRTHMPEPDRATRRRRLLKAQQELLALGLTCVHDMGIDADVAEIYRELESEGLLRLRIVAYLSGNGGLSEELLAEYPWRSARPDRLDIIGVKLIADGALGSRGAALIDDYTDAPGENGELLLDKERMTDLVYAAWKAGLQPAIHAIGDRANRLALDVYETMVQVDEDFMDLRPRIEHAQVVAPRDWHRFPTLRIVPSMQPVHAASDMAWAPARLGPERTDGAYGWRELAGDTSPLAFGSDFPVESPNPLLGIVAARSRRDLEGHERTGFKAEDALDGQAALDGFTVGAAHACAQEGRRGKLQPGFAVDMTVLPVDPVEVDVDELIDVRVLMTVIDGLVVYRPEPVVEPDPAPPESTPTNPD